MIWNGGWLEAQCLLGQLRDQFLTAPLGQGINTNRHSGQGMTGIQCHGWRP